MSFQTRIAQAHQHEQWVIDHLTSRGWLAESFGQAMLSEPMREHLRRVDTSVRWMPDIIAAKNYAAGERIIFIDAKAGDKYKQTGNHDIELSALQSAERWIELSGDKCPYYFIFENGSVSTPGDVREFCWSGSFRGNGSGTPFVLFPAAICRDFTAVFGDASARLECF